MRLLVERFPETARDLWTDEDTVEVQIPRGSVVETLRSLRDDPQFGFYMLADAAAVVADTSAVDAAAALEAAATQNTVVGMLVLRNTDHSRSTTAAPGPAARSHTKCLASACKYSLMSRHMRQR